MAAKRLGQPPVLGEIIVGILLGPALFHGKITATLFPITLRPPRDIAEADRAALGTAAEHRILVLIEPPEAAAPLVEVGVALAAGREHSQLMLSHLAAHQHDTRLEVGTGLGGELIGMTRSTGKLRALADRASAVGCQRSCSPGSARTLPPSCPAMWRLPSLTPSC